MLRLSYVVSIQILAPESVFRIYRLSIEFWKTNRFLCAFEADPVVVQAVFNGMVRDWHGVLLCWVEGKISRKMSGCRGRKRLLQCPRMTYFRYRAYLLLLQVIFAASGRISSITVRKFRFAEDVFPVQCKIFSAVELL
ncbi:MAG: hypothetical protein D3924_00325 [Candidatus Electrothrix sp. AR4]|nr:hypothetical protein [Candidatus Electrothrix sp. AR4]